MGAPDESRLTVSVLVATYNRVHLLRDTLHSLISQTHPDLEIVVVDDGSTDGTSAMVAEIERRQVRKLVYWRQPNAGCASARNRGLELSTGDAIAFLDSDDTWLPTAAADLVGALAKSNADFVYSPAIESYPNGTEWVHEPVAAFVPESFATEHFLDTNLRNGAYMFRRSLLAKVRGFDGTLTHNEDSDFVQRMALHGRACYFPEPTVRVRHHAGNKSRDRVAIYGSLIRSSEQILAENPAFANLLGDTAVVRLKELSRRYVEALIADRQIDAAQAVARSKELKPTMVTRIALATHSPEPIILRDHLRSLAGRVRTRMGFP